jgi:hypothetical protein
VLGESLVKLGTLVVLKQMGEQRESTELTGGGGGIRTHETLSGLTVFKTVVFDRSTTPPQGASDAKNLAQKKRFCNGRHYKMIVSLFGESRKQVGRTRIG